MALPASLKRFTSALPYALRLDIEGYVRTVDAAHPEIYEQARVARDDVSLDEFLFCAGLWRLWTQVESQRWLVKNSLDLAREFGADGITAGSYSYSRGSEDVRQTRELHDAFMRWLDNRNLRFVTEAQGPRSILESLSEMPDRGD